MSAGKRCPRPDLNLIFRLQFILAIKVRIGHLIQINVNKIANINGKDILHAVVLWDVLGINQDAAAAGLAETVSFVLGGEIVRGQVVFTLGEF